MMIAGTIIAGGRAERLGGEKPFRRIAGTPLLAWVCKRILPQVDRLALNLRADAPEVSGAVVLRDPPGPATGPLAGVVAALEWAEQIGADWLATVPSDTPFLPADLVEQLLSKAQRGRSAFAADYERPHYLCALWPVGGSARLRHAAASGTRRLSEVHALLRGIEVPIETVPHAFFNINTPADWAEAERLLHQSGLGA